MAGSGHSGGQFSTRFGTREGSLARVLVSKGTLEGTLARVLAPKGAL